LYHLLTTTKLVINSAKLSPTTNIILSGCSAILSTNPCSLFIMSAVVCIIYIVSFSMSTVSIVMDRWSLWNVKFFHLYFDLQKHTEHSHADSPWILSMSTEHKRDWPCCHVNVALFPWHVSRFLNVHFASALQVFLRLFLGFANILQLLRFILLYFPARPFAQSKFPFTPWFIFIVSDHSSVIAIQILFDS